MGSRRVAKLIPLNRTSVLYYGMNATTSNDIPTPAVKDELEEIRESMKTLAKATDSYVHHNAWASVGFAAALGLCLGLLLGGSDKGSTD